MHNVLPLTALLRSYFQTNYVCSCLRVSKDLTFVNICYLPYIKAHLFIIYTFMDLMFFIRYRKRKLQPNLTEVRLSRGIVSKGEMIKWWGVLTPVEVFARKLTIFIYSLPYLPKKNKMQAFVITIICVYVHMSVYPLWILNQFTNCIKLCTNIMSLQTL
jgi:hypothetical protein